MAFWWLAALLSVLALAFLVPRLLRGNSDHSATAALRGQLKSLEVAFRDGHLKKKAYTQRHAQVSKQLASLVATPARLDRSPATAMALAVILPATTLGLYLWKGTPSALHGSAMVGQTTIPELAESVASLKAKLEANPDNVNDWVMLGQSYVVMQDFDAAVQAYAQANRQAPNTPFIMVEYAAAIGYAAGDLPPQSEDLLRKALALEPSYSKALALLGVIESRKGNHAAAIELWQSLQRQLEPGDPLAPQLAAQIEQLQTRMAIQSPNGEAAPLADTPSRTVSSPSAANSSLTIEVALDEALADRVAPNDTVFVFARASEGPRMPLAIQRLSVSQLPFTIQLDESMAMTPSMSLATFPQVVVGARISKSGDAMPQPGDFQALSNPVPNNRSEPIQLLIDTVL